MKTEESPWASQEKDVYLKLLERICREGNYSFEITTDTEPYIFSLFKATVTIRNGNSSFSYSGISEINDSPVRTALSGTLGSLIKLGLETKLTKI